MKCEKVIIVLLLGLFLASCELTPFSEASDVVNLAQTNLEQVNTLFDEIDQNRKFIFETNDLKYLGVNGYTLWTVPEINESSTFELMNVEVIKESGRPESGYGLVFCEQIIDEKSYMLTVLINANGYYAIGKVSDGVFTHVNDGWKSSNYINKGVGIKNVISVSYNEVTKNFMLKINGYEISSFAVSEEITFKDSRYGFVVVISDKENFPNIPVKIIFENK